MYNYRVNPNLVQKYIQKYIKEEVVPANIRLYYYEATITFNRNFWSWCNAVSRIDQILADVIKPMVRDKVFNKWYLRYCVEYHEDGFPHVHLQVCSNSQVQPDIQQQIHARLNRRYGISQWYQTGLEDKLHKNDHFKLGPWSEYLQKDREKNNLEKGVEHYYSYKIGF
jgi:hypothetical protein